MNNNEKQKLDSIIVRIVLIFVFVFLAVEAWKNVFGIARNDYLGSEELRQDIREAERETNELKKSLEEVNRDRTPNPNQ